MRIVVRSSSLTEYASSVTGQTCSLPGFGKDLVVTTKSFPNPGKLHVCPVTEDAYSVRDEERTTILIEQNAGYVDVRTIVVWISGMDEVEIEREVSRCFDD